MDIELLEDLYEQVTPRRRKLFEEISKTRTYHLTVAIEDVGHLHNTSAVMRSCEAFGIQNMHVVEELHGKRIDREIAMGAQKWTSIMRHRSAGDALSQLKKKGYRIVATTPHDKEHTLANFDLARPAALFFGSEAKGLSDEVLKAADDFIYIPTFGFTQSLNISVSAAIILQDLMHRLREPAHLVGQSKIDWQLTQEQQLELQLFWLKRHGMTQS